jgi:hypothetical protein
MGARRTGGPWRSWPGRMGQRRRNGPSWPPPIPRACLTPPLGSLFTNLPAPTERLGTQPPFAAASLQEVIRLYGLRMWVEQSRHPGQAYPGVVEVTSEKRSGDPAALAVGVVRLLVLLVSCEPLQHQDDPGGAIAACVASCTRTRGSGFESRNGEKKSARNKGSGQQYPGHWRCGQCAGGWSLGSWLSRYWSGWSPLPPPASRCRGCSTGLSAGRLSLSTVPLDPPPQTTGRGIVMTRR